MQEKINYQVAIGSIENIKRRNDGLVKYHIVFNDEKGHTHKVWTNWLSDNDYEIGTSIPLRISSKGNKLVMVDRDVQSHHNIFMPVFIASLVSITLGYFVGKNVEELSEHMRKVATLRQLENLKLDIDLEGEISKLRKYLNI